MSVRRGLVAVLVAGGLALSGCGAEVDSTEPVDGSSSVGSSEEAAAGGDPQCDDVWVAGATLPGGYRGCFEGETKAQGESRMCEFGKRLHTYDDRFWAVPGGRIGDAQGPLLDSRDYRRVLTTCSG